MNVPTAAAKPAERLKKLRDDFVSHLPGRIGRMREVLGESAGHGCDCCRNEELQRLFHNLKGSAAVFGFDGLREIALEGEILANGCDDSTRCRQALGFAVDRLERAAAEIAGAPVAAEGGEFLGFNLDHAGLPATADACGRLIYVCDDDAASLDQLVTQVGCFGYEVQGFPDTAALERAIDDRRPDCVVMDIHFPDNRNSGTEFMAAINRRFDPPLNTVFISARDDFEARLHAVRAGGTSYFLKPVRSADLAAVLDEITHVQPVEPYRILVIDDEREVAAYHCMILEEAGMMTTRVSDPLRALEVLEAFRPDMVLMDMYMPGCSGTELAQVIRQVPSHFSLPILFFSSESDQRKQRAAMRIGADGFMVKPIDPVALVSEVAIRAERTRALRALIVRDSLTGLFNHSTTLYMLENAIAASDRNRTGLCFALIDIDHFKRINDSYGHRAGDQVIASLARMLKQHFRNSDVIGRHGGEEFAVIMPYAALDMAVARIDQLRTLFERVEFADGAQAFTCTFSAGVAQHVAGSSLASLFGVADRALYRAKQGGRNRVLASVSEAVAA
ncbi:diguanylate cyclase [Thauera aromatica]|uniref:diguanylate cyclase n=1 Tax=Thauera aromatica TaxID=59405 RepID=UPI001FFDE286|nr:diguanylate cyclase [Thauera aromatica]MCK2089291.1 diguanylate cyclase [Thauera aromatica]